MILALKKLKGTKYTMNIIRYQNPALSTWPRFDRRASWRDLLDSAFELSHASPGWIPALDVYDDEDTVTVQLEVAGVKKDDFDLSLEDDVLTISGQRESERGESFRSEREFGSFSRSITLPSPVKAEEVKADYENGILTVTLPKAEEAKPKKIQVSLN